METWSFSIGCLDSKDYTYDIKDVLHLENFNKKYPWMDSNTTQISVVKAKTIDTNEDVIAIYIYYLRKNPYGKKGRHNSSKSYHLFNGEVYGSQGKVNNHHL